MSDPLPIARRVRISEDAAPDIKSIGDYIAEDSPSRAQAFLAELERRIQSLATFAERFPHVAESRVYRETVRCLLHGPYRVLYPVRGDFVYILRVRHGARRTQRRADD
ncbi:MAG: type II toxin-antitoxin system RelE/ParE family toxin [Phycisphaerales bacterium]